MKYIFCISVLALSFVGCESKNDDQINAAQQCLNHATPSTVDTCVAKVAGMSSSQAYTIRCAADFIKQNIDTDRIVNALDKTNASNATVTALSFFTFRTVDSTSGSDLVSLAVSDCAQTGSQVLHDLALLSQMATIVSGLASLVPTADGIDPTALQSWITTVDPNSLGTTELEALGGVIQQAQPSYCGAGGQFEGTGVCTDLNNAISGGNAAQMAKDLLNQLKH